MPPARTIFVEAAIRAAVVARPPSAAVDGSVPPARARAADPPAPARANDVSPLRAAPSSLPEERIAAARTTLDPASARGFVVRPQIVARAAAVAAGPAAPPAPAAVSPALFRDAGRFASALGIAPDEAGLAALRSALEEPAQLMASLRTLEKTLAALPVDDPRVATVQTIVAFVSALDPKSPTFASALSAFVSHIVDGGEPKLVSLLTALRDGAGGVNLAGARLALDHDLKTTEQLGTVAIDLRTADRAVAVGVLAESDPAVTVFRNSLDRLSNRLESLRYRVASVNASVAPAATPDTETGVPATAFELSALDGPSRVDIQI